MKELKAIYGVINLDIQGMIKCIYKMIIRFIAGIIRIKQWVDFVKLQSIKSYHASRDIAA